MAYMSDYVHSRTRIQSSKFLSFSSFIVPPNPNAACCTETHSLTGHWRMMSLLRHYGKWSGQMANNIVIKSRKYSSPHPQDNWSGWDRSYSVKNCWLKNRSDQRPGFSPFLFAMNCSYQLSHGGHDRGTWLPNSSELEAL